MGIADLQHGILKPGRTPGRRYPRTPRSVLRPIRAVSAGSGQPLVGRLRADAKATAQLPSVHIRLLKQPDELPSLMAAYVGDHGADVFRACVACHTLGADQANRAGPTLAGIFGRRIATAPGYNFSEALKRLDIVWTPETVAKLFEMGPAAYTPGTKMPEQRIGSEADRTALEQFLERATKR